MLVPIACRFVPYDQWLVTHVDDCEKVNQLKLWILSRCNLVQSSGPHSHRPVSPIVFASSIRARSSLDSLDDGYSEDDEFSDQDLAPAIYPHREPHPGPSARPRSSPLVDQYSLLSFSTGSLLEDEFPLSQYNLRPYELLEMHPLGFVAPLHRDVLADYIQPYFRARVRVLRSVWNHKSGRFEAPGIDTAHKAIDKLTHRFDALSTKSSPLHSEKKRKTKIEWKARWVIVNQGVLSVCKDHVTSAPVQQFELSTITALHGTDALERALSVLTQPRVICIEFRRRSSSITGMASPPPSLPSSPISEELKVNAQETFPCSDSAFDVKQTAEPGGQDSPHGPNDAYKGQGEWVVFDMLNDHAFSSILRILHRQAVCPISSSFVPSPSIIVAHNSIPSPAASSFASYDTIPYPEWRINTVENARKAGMGDVGKAMARMLWSDKGLGETLLSNIRHHRQTFSQEIQYKIAFPRDIYSVSDDEDDDESEMEWEGWMRDLERQKQVKQPSEKATKPVAPPREAHVSLSTSLPSPPISGTSPSGSPRVRSPSFSVSQLAAHTQYPNIGNVIQAGGARGYRSAEHPHSPEKIKSTTVNTVTIGMAPPPRRRSSTLLMDLRVTKRDRDKGRQDREPLPSTRVNPRTVSISVSTPVRHTRSSSNLRVSSSPYASDVVESAAHPGPSSPSKRQSAFMRGMSLRAGKLVRGLESAIDFVDEKTA